MSMLTAMRRDWNVGLRYSQSEVLFRIGIRRSQTDRRQHHNFKPNLPSPIEIKAHVYRFRSIENEVAQRVWLT